MGIFQIKYIAEYIIGLNTKNKLNIMKRKKERKKERKKGRKEERRKEEEINKGELVYTSSPLYYNCTFKAKSI